jgi:hypothetical protein
MSSAKTTEAWLGTRLLPESRGKLIAVGLAVAILAVLGIAGALPIVHAVSKPSVSKRVSKETGREVSCTRVGEAAVAGRPRGVYRCVSEPGTPRSARCYSVVGGKVYPVYSLRKVGC